MTATGEVSLLVVRLSDSFSDFWPMLARDVGLPLSEWHPAADEVLPRGPALIILAAGGREAEISDVLAQLAIPADVPVWAVGSAASGMPSCAPATTTERSRSNAATRTSPRSISRQRWR